MLENTLEETASVLVVDDEDAIRYSVSKTLQRVGYNVNSAASGEEALDMLSQEHFDVVLTDIRMPGISGVELLAQIKDNSQDTIVILMTGYASLSTAVESLRLGAHDYLVKPSSSQDIRDSVAKGLARARALQRRRSLLGIIEASVKELTDNEEKEENNNGRSTHRRRLPSKPDIDLGTMELGPLIIYPGRYQIAVDDRPIDLTPTEFDLLLYLAAHRGRVVPCHELVREVRGYVVEEREAREVIRPHISNLRRKLKEAGQNPDLIINVRGIGYRLAEHRE